MTVPMAYVSYPAVEAPGVLFHRWGTDAQSHAIVAEYLVGSDPSVLLHDLISERKGDGAALMEAVVLHFADRPIKLVCEPRLEAYYQRFGFRYVKPFIELIEMRREPGPLPPREQEQG